MTEREKLIELIRKADKEDNESLTQDVHYAFMADHLIANGVTIPVRCKDCWKNGEGMCSYQFKDVPGKDFCGDGERRTDDKRTGRNYYGLCYLRYADQTGIKKTFYERGKYVVSPDKNTEEDGIQSAKVL